jgi:hypothetical protein
MELIESLSLQSKNAQAKYVDHNGRSAGEKTPADVPQWVLPAERLNEQHPA